MEKYSRRGSGGRPEGWLEERSRGKLGLKRTAKKEEGMPKGWNEGKEKETGPVGRMGTG